MKKMKKSCFPCTHLTNDYSLCKKSTLNSTEGLHKISNEAFYFRAGEKMSAGTAYQMMKLVVSEAKVTKCRLLCRMTLFCLFEETVRTLCNTSSPSSAYFI